MARNKNIPDDSLPKVKVNKESINKFKELIKHGQPKKAMFALGLMFLFLTSLTALAFPLFLGSLIDAANDEGLQKINEIGIILFVVFSLQAVFSFFRVLLFVNVTENMLAKLRQSAYSKLITLPMNFFSNRRVGELNSRISADISLLQDTFTTTIAEFLRQSMLIIGGIAFLSYTSTKLTLIMLSVVPVIAVLAVVFGRKIRAIAKNVQDETATSNTIVEETLQGIANVKAFANEWFEEKRYKNSTERIVVAAIKGGFARGAFASFIIFCLFGAIVFVIWYGVRLVNAGELSVGSMFQFVLYSVFVGASIGGIAELYAQIQKTLGATERLLEILDEKSEESQEEMLQKSTVGKLNGKIAFQKVNFYYGDREDIPVLKNLSFEIEAGQMIAVVGPSGAGKSTITNLLLRFYAPQNGEILVDDKNINEYTLASYRRNIAIVPQDVFLFGGSIIENIWYGKPEASKEEVIEAAKKANAHNFIIEFPENYETTVGERGVKLSGGQRQRIAIARAILKNPAILILDEATSSLDSESERVVQEALENLMKGRTSIVIAHRLATIKKADKILVLEKGEIKESGTHNDLIEIEDGLYNKLSSLQFTNSAWTS
jgi:ABC transporter fused permease/ATP-binding protein